LLDVALAGVAALWELEVVPLIDVNEPFILTFGIVVTFAYPFETDSITTLYVPVTDSEKEILLPLLSVKLAWALKPTL